MKILNRYTRIIFNPALHLKTVFLILWPVLIPVPVSCQGDSVMAALIQSGLSKPEIIKKGTDEILKSMSDENMARARQIIDYMLSDVEDSLYAAFDLYNYRLILYWMHDYERLIGLFLNFDSLAANSRHKIKPGDSELYMSLAWSLPEAAKPMFSLINKTGLGDDCKEALILDLHKRAMEVDGGDYYLNDYSKRVSRFSKNFPESRLKKYVKKHIGRLNSWDEK